VYTILFKKHALLFLPSLFLLASFPPSKFYCCCCCCC